MSRIKPGYDLERSLLAQGLSRVAGVDEVGRGPLAGPVVAAAVILPEVGIPDGIDDSKRLSKKTRERLHDEILRVAIVGVGIVSAAEIDRINIRQATFAAMRLAIEKLSTAPCHLLIDGNDKPGRLTVQATTVVKGDAVSLSIAAASVVAKVVRDRLMEEACVRFPAYGFSRHAGYGTAEHMAAIRAEGPCEIHRLSFGPLKAFRPTGDLFSVSRTHA